MVATIVLLGCFIEAEKEKFLKIAYDEAWKDFLQKCPETGPKLRELLTKKK